MDEAAPHIHERHVFDVACRTMFLDICKRHGLELDEVSELAYDKAVEVVDNIVKLETHKEDIRLVEQSKAWVLSPEQKASKKECEYVAKRLEGVITKITDTMKTTLQKIQANLMKPKIRKNGTEQIKQKSPHFYFGKTQSE